MIIGKHCLIIAQTGIAGSARLEDYVTVAAQAGVAGHVTIGSKAILAGRTGELPVSKAVSPTLACQHSP